MRALRWMWLWVLAAALAATGVSAEPRHLMPCFEQECTLAYAALSAVRSPEVDKKLIGVRDDNYRFMRIDSSFAMRNILAVWLLSQRVRGYAAGPLYPLPPEPPGPIEAATSVGRRMRILEILAREAEEAKGFVAKGAAYRMPVLVLGDRGELELTEPLGAVAGELPVSRRATARWNDRLPLYGPDVAEAAVPPYVITSGEGKNLSCGAVVVTRDLAEAIERHLRSFRNATRALGSDERKVLRREITPENLTQVLLAMMENGEM